MASTATTTTTSGIGPAKTVPADLIQTEANTVSVPVQFPNQVAPENELKINDVPAPQMVTPLSRLGERPEFIDCPFCKKRTETTISKEGSDTQCIAGWAEDIHHSCSNCKRRVATKLHSGKTKVYASDPAVQVPSNYAPTQAMTMPEASTEQKLSS
ncbi:uncharacterized protein NECHADRAFT_77175 [Fusarium vanettenii 77-13-4]|uniref:LITAF domain-containing protein n=1 Tax=Fusarium vanettenii (strain ATCC MYA-4622 / CBS 123669 / FGSC 9596 / NRRL 45880 / 77-13-4) TaxID=660122 RepID=C7ZJ91_FUSV7|nr:uncharacterized protein NECHADRAFT_77175 [Fusarium vanettenii 77-13-4]EEU35863.1 hypothetical protein NECHADRAFT_77175 [Fusarium vanettenii 77-13-4]